MKKIFNIFFFVILFPLFTQASHYMGGEITWECLSNGKYVFTMKVYRECNGIQFNANEVLTVLNNPSVTSILMTRISQTDISPQCNAIGPHITCDSVTAPNQGGIQEDVYMSGEITLIGIPPVQGWIFMWGSCCRNPSTNINNASSLDWLLRVVMYSYTPPGSSSPLNANPCFDNSPQFVERPLTALCTAYPFTYNYNTFDAELDSLAYEWAPPLINLTTPISSWAAGYSFNSPLPGTVHNPNNVPATVNPYTGEISFTSFTQGAFQTDIKVTAFKSGLKVAEIFKEMQIVLLACDTNNPPAMIAPFQNVSSFIDTVYAGELVTFSIALEDFDTLLNGQQQTINALVTGTQFGTNFTDTNGGCLNPPCAILNPVPPLTGQYGVQTNFSWQTDCAHLINSNGQPATTTTYNFVINSKDDFCPVPGQTIKTITIVIVPRKLPHLYCKMFRLIIIILFI